MSYPPGIAYERGRSRSRRNISSCPFPDFDLIEALVDCGTRIDDYLDDHKFYRRRRSRRHSNSFDSYKNTREYKTRSSSRRKKVQMDRHGLVEERYVQDFEDPLPMHSLYDRVGTERPEATVQRHGNIIEHNARDLSFYGGSSMTTQVANNSIQDRRFSGSSGSRRIPSQMAFVNHRIPSQTSLSRGQYDELEPENNRFTNPQKRTAPNLMKGYQEGIIPPGTAGLTLLNTTEGLVIQHIKSTSVAHDLKVGDVIVVLDGVDITRYPSEIVLQLLERKRNFHRSIVFKRYNSSNNDNSFRKPLPRDGSLKRDVSYSKRMNSSLRSMDKQRREV